MKIKLKFDSWLNENQEKRMQKSIIPTFMVFSLFLSSVNLHAENSNESIVKKIITISNQNEKKQINGVVLDDRGETLIGVSVLIKGTTTGTVTDYDGNFSIKAAKGDVLELSYIGYQPISLIIDDKPALKIVMKEDTKMLEEVVIVGFGTQKKINVTGAVSTVDAKVLESRPVQNVAQALQGVVPGLNFSVNSTGGTLDNAMNVNIRGAGTIGDGSNSAPLILIDGMEGNMNAINPNDIESVTVLKDAASSAIYGSRASFGVILITTKNGKAGRTSINYSANVRFTDALAIPEMMDSYTFAQFFNRSAENAGQSPVFNDSQMERILQYQRGEITDGTTTGSDGRFWQEYGGANANTDWFAEQYRNWVPSQEHNLSVNGGSEKITYLVSGTFSDQNGLIRHGEDNLQRFTLNAKINAELSDWVSMNYSTRWIREQYDRPAYMTGLFFHNIARRWPTSPVKDPNGFYMNGSEIIQMEEGGRDNSEKDWMYQQAQLIIEPIDDWRIVADGNLQTITRFNHWDQLPVFYHDANGQEVPFSWNGGASDLSAVSESGYKETFLTTNIYTDYFKEFENGHYFKAMAGFNAEVMNTRNLTAVRDGLISPSVPTINTTTTNPRVGGGYAHWSTVGFFGRLNYNYKERYMAEANVRYDGTSRFIGDQRWGIFPSFSAGWNIAKEEFFEDLDIDISTFKLRGSWGQLGNMNTKAWYPFYQSMPTGAANGGWLVDGERPNTANAPGIVSSMMTWETIESWNIGLDWAALNNRLTGSFDYFKRLTNNMIGPAPQLPGILGTGVPKINNADMESYGFELELGWRDRIGEVYYGVKGVLADDRQKVTRYPNELGDIGQWYNDKMSGEIWGYETLGIAKTDEEMNNHLASLPNGGQSALGNKWAAGDIMYADLNGDGKIDSGSSTLQDSGDRSIIGNNSPRFKFGLTLDAAWKGLDISLFFQGVGKRDYMLGGAYFWGANGGMWQSAGFNEHWDFFRPEGDPLGANQDSYYPRPIFDTGKNQQTQSRYLQNAAYIRLKNIQLGYKLPQSWMTKLNMQSVRIYVSGENLWTGSSITGIFDPETLGSDWGDGKLYPLSKTISVGLNVNF